jgi:hypothetical protein
MQLASTCLPARSPPYRRKTANDAHRLRHPHHGAQTKPLCVTDCNKSTHERGHLSTHEITPPHNEPHNIYTLPTLYNFSPGCRSVVATCAPLIRLRWQSSVRIDTSPLEGTTRRWVCCDSSLSWLRSCDSLETVYHGMRAGRPARHSRVIRSSQRS